jgi:hypothetical protein
VLGNQVLQELHWLCALKLKGKLNSCAFFKPLDEVYLFPLARNIHLLVQYLNPAVVSVQWFLYYAAKEFFCELYHIAVVGIGAVQLAGGKLRIVGLIYALVSKVLPDLKHSGNTADQQSL